MQEACVHIWYENYAHLQLHKALMGGDLGDGHLRSCHPLGKERNVEAYSGEVRGLNKIATKFK